jgi:hypothetical protein
VKGGAAHTGSNATSRDDPGQGGAAGVDSVERRALALAREAKDDREPNFSLCFSQF